MYRIRRLLKTNHGRLMVLIAFATGLAILTLRSAPWLAAALVVGMIGITALLSVDTHKKQAATLRLQARQLKLGNTTTKQQRELQREINRVLPQVHELMHDQYTTLDELRVSHERTRQAIEISEIRLRAASDLVLSDVRSLGEGVAAVGAHIERSIDASQESLSKTVTAGTKETVTVARKAQESIRAKIEDAIGEVDAIMQVHERNTLAGERPTLGGWAISPKGMLQLMNIIERARPTVVLECGSGTSTIYLAAAMRAAGITEAKLIALEHLPRFVDSIGAILREHGLDAIAEVRHTPLVPHDIDGDTYQWYDIDSLSGLSGVDLLLVDGPPATTGPMARYPALPLLWDRLQDGCVVVADDASRADEQHIAERWQEMFPLQRLASTSKDQSIFLVRRDD